MRQDGGGQAHIWQLDVVRCCCMIGVITVHSVSLTNAGTSILANAVLMVLHVNREVFFFLTALVLTYSTRARTFGIGSFWRRRYPLVLVPYLVWTMIYWTLSLGLVALPRAEAYQLLWSDLTHGFFQLYFLLVTMQFYAVFPALLWVLLRWRSRLPQIVLASAVLQTVMTAAIQYWSGRLPAFMQSSDASVEVWAYQFYFIAGIAAGLNLERVLGWISGHRGRLVAAVAAAFLAAEVWYAVSVALTRNPYWSASVFQPMILVVSLATLVGLWLAGDLLISSRPLAGRFWTRMATISDISFGVFLFHMVPLLLLVQTQLWVTLGLSRLPAIMATPTVAIMTVLISSGVVACARRTPVSVALTGRPRVVLAGGIAAGVGA